MIFLPAETEGSTTIVPLYRNAPAEPVVSVSVLDVTAVFFHVQLHCCPLVGLVGAPSVRSTALDTVKRLPRDASVAIVAASANATGTLTDALENSIRPLASVFRLDSPEIESPFAA